MFYKEEKSKIVYYKSSILDNENIVHCFTTRAGDCQKSPHNGFSLGLGGFDELKTIVKDNRKKFCELLQIDYKKLINPDQQHTDNIKIVTSIDDDLSNTDGIITAQKGLVIMLLFADCTPIILHAPNSGVIGVIHAGWKGTAKKIAKKAITMMTNELNVDINDIKAAIGPTIGQCCYPVSTEVAEQLQLTISKNHDKLFINADSDDKIKVDLKALNALQLEEAGVKHIDVINECTSCNNSVFFSYRAENGKTGRHAAVACLK